MHFHVRKSGISRYFYSHTVDGKIKSYNFNNGYFFEFCFDFLDILGEKLSRSQVFFFHVSNRSYDLSFNVYHWKTDFSKFWKWWKNDIWHGNSRYFQRLWSEFFEFQDSGSKSLKLSFPLLRTWFGPILSDLEQCENRAYFQKSYFFNDFCLKMYIILDFQHHIHMQILDKNISKITFFKRFSSFHPYVTQPKKCVFYG